MSSTPTVPRLKKMVELMLDENPKWRGVQVRNSDIALTIIIWQRWYNVSDKDDGVVHLYRLMDLPREDNVKRIRAVIQNTEHRFLPTDPSVLYKRGIEAEYWADALGYRLTPEEWKLHHKTVAETKPPVIATETDMLVAGETTAKPYTPSPTEPTPVTYTTKMQAVYLPKAYSSSSLKQNEQYEIEIEQLATGRPIKMVAPIEAVYPNLQSFGKTWRVVS